MSTKEKAFEKENELIAKFMKDNDLYPMHLEMFLDTKYGIVCRSKEDDDEIAEELECLRN